MYSSEHTIWMIVTPTLSITKWTNLKLTFVNFTVTFDTVKATAAVMNRNFHFIHLRSSATQLVVGVERKKKLPHLLNRNYSTSPCLCPVESSKMEASPFNVVVSARKNVTYKIHRKVPFKYKAEFLNSLFNEVRRPSELVIQRSSSSFTV